MLLHYTYIYFLQRKRYTSKRHPYTLECQLSYFVNMGTSLGGLNFTPFHFGPVNFSLFTPVEDEKKKNVYLVE